MNDWMRWRETQWCEHCNRDVTYFGHATDCPEYDAITLVPVEQRIAEAVAAEREAIIAICMEAGDTALANKCGEIAGAIYVTVARIRARAGGEEAKEVVR